MLPFFKMTHLMQQNKGRYEIQGIHLHSCPRPSGYPREFPDCRREREVPELEVDLDLAMTRTKRLSFGSTGDLP